MKMIHRFIYCALLVITLIINVIVFCIYGLGDLFFYLFTSSLYYIFPFITLFYILFLNLKNISYKENKYDEVALMVYILVGTLILYLYTKLTISISLWIYLICDIVLFIVITIVFGFIRNKKKRSK